MTFNYDELNFKVALYKAFMAGVEWSEDPSGQSLNIMTACDDYAKRALEATKAADDDGGDTGLLGWGA